jgi:DNA-nicking Smr family endonuclease
MQMHDDDFKHKWLQKNKLPSDREKEGNLLWRYVTQSIQSIHKSPVDQHVNVPVQSQTMPQKDEPFLLSLDQLQKIGKTITPLSLPSEQTAMPRTNRSLYQKLRRGQIPWQRIVDLHGMGKDHARITLESQIIKAYQQKERCVLVITGKGKGIESLFTGYGILRQSFPAWITSATLSPYVLDYATSIPRHGGEGAFYVLIAQ